MNAIRGLSLGGSGRLAVVAALHVALIYLIATSLGIVKPPAFVQPMEAVLISDPQPKEEVKPVIAKPELVEPTLEIPEPDVIPIPEVQVPLDVASNAVSASPSDAVESTELQVANRVAPGYPPASLRASEEGTVILRVLVDEKGRPMEVNVMKSSGFTRLDDAAMKAVHRWIFVPPTREGQPVRSWSRVQVRFEIKNA